MDSNLIDKMKLNLDNNLINKKNKINNQSSLEEVAQEFESLYVFQMLKSARKAKLADDIPVSYTHLTLPTIREV